MNSLFATINAFIEDTCVIFAIAYFLTRGRRLELLFAPKPTRSARLITALILGAIALSEPVFPGARYPYVTHTLIVTFATLIGGLSLGGVTALIVVLGAGAGRQMGADEERDCGRLRCGYPGGPKSSVCALLLTTQLILSEIFVLFL